MGMRPALACIQHVCLAKSNTKAFPGDVVHVSVSKHKLPHPNGRFPWPMQFLKKHKKHAFEGGLGREEPAMSKDADEAGRVRFNK